jgi:putative ATP-binding cassette transporter
MQKWQIELYSTPSWLLQTLLMVAAASAVILFIQPYFGQQQRNHRRNQQQNFDGTFRRQTQPQDIAKLAPEACVALLLTEVRLNVLSTFMSKGLYDSMQDRQTQPQDIAKLAPEACVACKKQNDRRGCSDHQ